MSLFELPVLADPGPTWFRICPIEGELVAVLVQRMDRSTGKWISSSYLGMGLDEIPQLVEDILSEQL